MLHFSLQQRAFQGSLGSLPIAHEDSISLRLAMLIEGECELGAKAAAEKFGLSRQRYFQLRQQFRAAGPASLMPQKRGPKHNYRRTEALVRQVIRHRFLDPDASAAVITQRLVQTGLAISCRSVERIFQDYGLQKKTLSPTRAAAAHRNATHDGARASRTR
jgi:transposase